MTISRRGFLLSILSAVAGGTLLSSPAVATVLETAPVGDPVAEAVRMARALCAQWASWPEDRKLRPWKCDPTLTAPYHADWDAFLSHMHRTITTDPHSLEVDTMFDYPWIYDSQKLGWLSDEALVEVTEALLPIYLVRTLLHHDRLWSDVKSIPTWAIFAGRYGILISNRGRMTPEFQPIQLLLQAAAMVPEKRAEARQRYFEWAFGRRGVAQA